MVFLGADFWPQFWTVIGGGAAVTVIVSLLVAVLPHSHAKA
jgi:hypothetical protein